eukprot:3238434-Prymnesium_polylepis.1
MSECQDCASQLKAYGFNVIHVCGMVVRYGARFEAPLPFRPRLVKTRIACYRPSRPNCTRQAPGECSVMHQKG